MPRYGATATVTLTVDIDVRSTWDKNTSVAQIEEQATKEARHMIMDARRAECFRITKINTVEVRARKDTP